MISNTNDLITRFGWADYMVFVMMLFISTAIGVFFGCSGTKQKSTAEFFMGGRTMGVFPVAMSLAARLLHQFIFLYSNQLLLSFVLFFFLSAISTLFFFYLVIIDSDYFLEY